jgi:porphobilinogen synthase
LRPAHDGDVANDETCAGESETLAQAKAGADIIAPSDVMDGRVRAIREALDEQHFEHSNLAYAAVRLRFEAPPGSGRFLSKFGGRRSYQMDPANQREAIREVALDIEEGADIVMVKPAMPGRDLPVKTGFDLPVAAYQVSGEYRPVAAHRNGWLDRERTILNR